MTNWFDLVRFLNLIYFRIVFYEKLKSGVKNYIVILIFLIIFSFIIIYKL